MLPVEFRDALGQWSPESECLGMLTAWDDCIMVVPWPEWEKFETELTKVPNPSPALRDYCRRVIGGAEELQLDPQNRLRLSRTHMEDAGLSREVILVGMLKRFEIWDVARYRQRTREKNFVEVHQELAEKGINTFW